MFATGTIFVGITCRGKIHPYIYSVVDDDLNLLAIESGEIDDVLSFIAGYKEVVVAIGSPQSPNNGLLADEDYRQQLNPPPKPGRWTNFRVVEYLIRLHNIWMPQTSGTVETCPDWMVSGFELYSHLEKMKFYKYPSRRANRQYMEIYPHASYSALLEQLPFPKESIEGRVQRQLILQDHRLYVADPMRVFASITRHSLLQGYLRSDDLYSQEELDTLVASFTAWKAVHEPDKTSMLGDKDEGEIVLPVPALREKY